ncbi:MAG: Smr/MutS family protein [Desulfobacterales bacterium]|nr:Smr/MutS family protein [Desulfobacterales bacterium]MDJ0914835.1 Smr/MutS family protein [Desulfobacterales bacterium]
MSKEPVHIPIDGVLDLHTFHPGDVPDLLNDYFQACLEEGIFNVRVVHGKGTGMLRERVHRLLERHPGVASFALASPESGGWGATLVELKRPKSS